MASLNFTKKGKEPTVYWEATAKVTADFAIHLERVRKGVVYVGVSTVEGGQYADHYQQVDEAVFDKDFDLQVYPKYIQVRSSTEVVSGSVETGGGGGVIPEDVEQRIADLENKAEQQEQILSTDDLDNNGIPDGEDRLRTIEGGIMDGEEMKKTAGEVFQIPAKA